MFIFYRNTTRRPLHSFPTRRSSDLARSSGSSMAFRDSNRSPGCTTASSTSSRSAATKLRVISTARSEEHTSELQSHHDLVCRLLLEKKKTYLRNSSRRLHWAFQIEN